MGLADGLEVGVLYRLVPDAPLGGSAITSDGSPISLRRIWPLLALWEEGAPMWQLSDIAGPARSARADEPALSERLLETPEAGLACRGEFALLVQRQRERAHVGVAPGERDD
jgi:hypothetical protein